MIAHSFLLALQVSLDASGASPRMPLDARRLAFDVQEAAAVGRGDAFVRRISQRSARAGRFAQGVLYRLRYDYASASREFHGLQALRPRDQWARAATLGLATVAQSRGLMRDVEVHFARALHEAREDGDSLQLLEVSIARTVTAARIEGPRIALVMLDSISDAAARKDSLVQATIHCRRGNVYAQAGDRRARAEFAAGIALASALHIARIEADCQLALYTHFIRAGHPDSGHVARERAHTILTRLGDSASLAGYHQWSGFNLIAVGHLDRAFVTLRTAERHAKVSRNVLVLGWTALNLADLFTRFGQFAEAEAQLDVVQRCARESGDNSLEDQLLRARAESALRRRDFRAAERALVAYRRSVEDSGRPTLMHDALLALADLHAKAGRSAVAHAIVDTARTVRARYRLSGWETAELNTRMLVYYLAGRLDSAAVFADTVLGRLASTQHAARFTMNVLRAGLFAKRNAVDQARARLVAAERDYNAWHQALTAEQLGLRASRVTSFGLGELQGLGLVFDMMARKGDGADVFEFDERRRARELRERLARLTTTSTVSAPSEWRRSASIGTRGTLSVTVSQLQRAIPDEHTAVVQFVAPVSLEKTTVLAITRRAFRVFAAPPLDSLSAAITRFSNLVRQGVVPSAAALMLGRTLMGSVVRSLPADINRLMIVPDGMLHRLPFDALQLDAGVSLVDRYGTASAPSSSVAAALWQRQRRADGVRLLAFGDPVLPAMRRDSVQPPYVEAMMRGEPLRRLPASRREVSMASRGIPSSVVYTGAEASEQTLKSVALRDFRVVHFATHALVNDWSLARTAMILASGRGEDGFLTPAELSNLSFDADIVVLSACRTAAGEFVGSEGIRGLAAPFLEAGARSIVATQWEVGDEAAARLGAALYRALRAGQPVIDAVRSARLEARRRGESAAVWAVLSVIGDSHARPFATD